MFDLSHVAMLMFAGLVGAWIWRGLGLRDRALILVRQHCQHVEVQLLDESIVLNRIRMARNKDGRLGVVRRYDFEFTVTGERRYTGSIQLHGAQLLGIELAPHPFPGSDPDQADLSGDRLL